MSNISMSLYLVLSNKMKKHNINAFELNFYNVLIMLPFIGIFLLIDPTDEFDLRVASNYY